MGTLTLGSSQSAGTAVSVKNNQKTVLILPTSFLVS